MAYVLHTRYPGKDTFEDELPDIIFKDNTDAVIVKTMVEKLNEILEKYQDILDDEFYFCTENTDKFSR